MKRKKEDAAETRKLLLNAAIKVFSRKGYAHTTLEGVAKEAGVTRGAIYWHFKNKLELFKFVLSSLYNNAMERAVKILESDDRPKEKIRRFILDLFLMSLDQEKFRIIEDVNLFKFEKRKELKEFVTKHQENVEALRKLIRDLIKKGIDAGEFDSRLDPEITTWALISYLAGMKSAWLSGVTDIYNPDNSEKLADIFINGIVKK